MCRREDAGDAEWLERPRKGYRKIVVSHAPSNKGFVHHSAVQPDETIFEIDNVEHRLTGTEQERESAATRIMWEKFPEANSIEVGRQIRGM